MDFGTLNTNPYSNRMPLFCLLLLMFFASACQSAHGPVSLRALRAVAVVPCHLVRTSLRPRGGDSIPATGGILRDRGPPRAIRQPARGLASATGAGRSMRDTSQVGELFLLGFRGVQVPGWLRDFEADFGLGGVILFDYDVPTAKRWC